MLCSDPYIIYPHKDAYGRYASWYGNRFMFQGREYLSEIILYDYRHRFYQPRLGAFLQTDPLGLQTEGVKLSTEQKALFSPGGVAPEAFTSSEMNLFRYCGDDPVDKSDPMGLKDREIDARDLKRAEDLLRAMEKDSRKDDVTRSQAVNKDGTVSEVKEAKVLTRYLMSRFKSDQSREEIPGNKDTISIISHVHADGRNHATHLPSEDTDLKTGKTIFILFGSEELRKQGQAILIVPHVDPRENPSQYTRPMIYGP